MSRVPRCVYCARELVAIDNPPRQCSEPKSLICNRDHSSDDTPRAADLPDGSVVANGRWVWFKDPYSSEYYPWMRRDGAASSNRNVDDALAAGARVLRYGYEGSSDDDR